MTNRHAIELGMVGAISVILTAAVVGIGDRLLNPAPPTAPVYVPPSVPKDMLRPAVAGLSRGETAYGPTWCMRVNLSNELHLYEGCVLQWHPDVENQMAITRTEQDTWTVDCSGCDRPSWKADPSYFMHNIPVASITLPKRASAGP